MISIKPAQEDDWNIKQIWKHIVFKKEMLLLAEEVTFISIIYCSKDLIIFQKNSKREFNEETKRKRGFIIPEMIVHKS